QQEGQSQLFIEAPYRNIKLFDQLLTTLAAQTPLTVAMDITSPNEFIETHDAAEWRKIVRPDMNKKPTIFIIG
ncbi:MAG: SAM-dependent methyltransferase, partial [Rikenellaceae bacterium]